MLLISAGCGRAAPQSTTSAAASTARPLHEGPLSDFVPAAGLRWMLVGSPRRIAEAAAFREAIDLLLPRERVSQFATQTGVELRRVDHALVAGFDLGTLYVWDAQHADSRAVTAHFRERLVSGEHVRQQAGGRIEQVTGVVGTTPESLVHIDQRLFAIAVGDPLLTRIVEAFAREKLRDSPPALKGAALSTLSPPPASSVATFYAPGPFSDEWSRAGRGLLAQALAVRVSLEPLDTNRARCSLEIAGDFSETGRDELEHAYRDLAESGLGKLVGLDQTSASPNLRMSDHALNLDVDLDVLPVARGLHAAVAADMWEILDIERPKDAAKRPSAP